MDRVTFSPDPTQASLDFSLRRYLRCRTLFCSVLLAKRLEKASLSSSVIISKMSHSLEGHLSYSAENDMRRQIKCHLWGL